ncbi:MAG: hypothetical protein WB988_22985, partial [Candidatus Nitrosopolaris sp.]
QDQRMTEIEKRLDKLENEQKARCLGRIYYHMSRLISGRQAQRVAPLIYVTTAMHHAAIGFTTRS